MTLLIADFLIAGKRATVEVYSDHYYRAGTNEGPFKYGRCRTHDSAVKRAQQVAVEFHTKARATQTGVGPLRMARV